MDMGENRKQNRTSENIFDQYMQLHPVSLEMTQAKAMKGVDIRGESEKTDERLIESFGGFFAFQVPEDRKCQSALRFWRFSSSRCPMGTSQI